MSGARTTIGPQEPATQAAETIYYYKIAKVPAEELPPVLAPGHGGNPGTGSLKGGAPPLGVALSSTRIKVVSSVPQPRILRQVVNRPALAPPDLKTEEIQLPDIVLESSGPSIPSSFYTPVPKPVPQRADRNELPAAVAPAMFADNQLALQDLQPIANAQTLSVSVAPLSRPIERDGGQTGRPEAPLAPNLMVIGIDKATGSALLVPAGSYLGQITIGDGPQRPGVPSTENSNAGNGGRQRSGSGGNEATGIGPAINGAGGSGGAGSSAAPFTVSIVGSKGKAGGPSAAVASITEDKIFPVVVAAGPRPKALIVSAGPIGGGGLGAYGALHCAKIDTIFLPMPGKSWTLQYCRAMTSAASDRQGTVVHLEPPLTPPYPDKKFDFQRLPVGREKVGKMIVLKGLLKEDGTVENLEVEEGVMPEMDEEAQQAFSRWAFKPALLEGKPVEVELLVGIPIDTGGQ